MEGREVQIPTLVPTLTTAEKDWLVNTWEEGQKIPKAIIDKAVAHARKRTSEGLSPFKD
jgi:hypothetical protein